MKQISLAILVVIAAGAGGLGFLLGRASVPHAPTIAGGVVVDPPADASEAIVKFSEALVRWKGPFRDSLDQLDARQKLEVYKSNVIAFGKNAFEPAVKFLGDPVKLAAAANVNAGHVNTDGGGRGTPALDPIVRDAVLELLPSLDPEKAAPELARRLMDDNESQRARARAAGELGHLDRRVSIPVLVEALDRASEHAWHGSRSIVEAMAILGGPEVAEALLQAFQRPSTTQELRIVVAQSLGTVKATNAVPALENAIRHEQRDHFVRREAIRALLRIDPDRADALTLEQIERETDASYKTFLQDVARSRGKLR